MENQERRENREMPQAASHQTQPHHREQGKSTPDQPVQEPPKGRSYEL